MRVPSFSMIGRGLQSKPTANPQQTRGTVGDRRAQLANVARFGTLLHMADDRPDDNLLPRLTCPYCGHEVAVEYRMGQIPLCPDCGGAIVIDDEPENSVDTLVKDAELSSLRILQLARQRRGLIRSRSYMLILAIACLVMATQLMASMLRLALNHANWQPGGRTRSTMFIALLAGWFLVSLILLRWFGRKASELKKQIFHSDLSEPATPPDYSSLCDGSQHFRALEQMTRPQPPENPDDTPPTR